MELKRRDVRTALAVILIASLVAIPQGGPALYAAKPGAAAPSALPSVPRIHVARGLWWDMLRIDEAGALMGGARYGVSHDHSRRVQVAFPASPSQFRDCNVIVLAGCRAGSIASESQQLLKQWVTHGGGLLVTGNVTGLGAGGYHGTVIEELLPIVVAEGNDLQKTPDGAVIVPTEPGRAFFDDRVPWCQKPRVYWVNRPVQLKDGVEVLLTADGQPLLVRWTVGNGRVVVFTGTVCGVSQPGQLTFWDWDGWPIVLSDVLAWLAQVPPAPQQLAGSEDPDYVKKLARLAELAEPDIGELLLADEDPDAGFGSKEKEGEAFGEIAALASACRDRAYAMAVVNALAESATEFNVASAESVYACISSYVSGGEFGQLALALVDSDNAGRAAIGLRLLGRTKAPEGRRIVLKYWADGLEALGGQQTDSIRRMGAPDGEDERLRLAAVRAVIDYADSQMLPDFQQASASWARQGSSEAFLVQLNADLAAEMQVAKCAMGDARAAVGLLKMLIDNDRKIEAHLDTLQRPVYVMTKQIARERSIAQSEIPLLRARSRRLGAAMSCISEAGLLALAESSDQWQGPSAARYLQGCLARPSGEMPSEPARGALLRIMESSRLPSIRALCVQRLLGCDHPRLTASLAKLAGGDAADARFAISQVPLLSIAEREPVVSAALANSEPSVRQAAVRAICLLATDDQQAAMDRARELAGTDAHIRAILDGL